MFWTAVGLEGGIVGHGSCDHLVSAHGDHLGVRRPLPSDVFLPLPWGVIAFAHAKSPWLKGDGEAVQSVAMEEPPPRLDIDELKAVVETLSVKEVKKLLKDFEIDVNGCLEKSELLDALLSRLGSDEKAKTSLFSFCRICCSWRLDDDMWPLTCGHLVCLQCLGHHLESQVQIMKSSLTYRLPCIYAPRCAHEIRFKDAAAMSDALRRIWKDLRHRERLIRDAKFEVLECPKAGCVGVAYKERGRRLAMCFMCEHTWEANPGGQDDWEKPQFDGDRVRRCPKCQSPIEKNGGCNHMTCTRCGRHFDWASSEPAGERSHAPPTSHNDFNEIFGLFGNGLPQGAFETWPEAAACANQAWRAVNGVAAQAAQAARASTARREEECVLM